MIEKTLKRKNKMKINPNTLTLDGAIKSVALILIVLFAIVLTRKYAQGIISNIRENQADNNVEKTRDGKNINIIAQAYKNAINPSGVAWLQWSDGTDEDAIYNLAIDTRGSLNEINRAFKNKFQISLVDELRSELSSEAFSKWYTIVT